MDEPAEATSASGGGRYRWKPAILAEVEVEEVPHQEGVEAESLVSPSTRMADTLEVEEEEDLEEAQNHSLLP